MKSTRLALRLTLNSLLMILGVYILMQCLVFLRDNIILGVGDFATLPATVTNFIVGSVLPPMAVFTVIIFLAGLRIQRVQEKLIRGETLGPEVLEKTRKRILGFSKMILVINLIGFVVGYILSQVLSGKGAELAAPNGILILVSNLAGSIAYAYAQTALNNLAFADLRERLGITRIGARKRELPNTFRQVLLSGLLAIYVLTLLQMNIYDLMRAQGIANRTLDAIRSGQLDPGAAAADYHERLGRELYSFSTRKTLDIDKVPLPWDRPESLADLQFQVFLIFGIFSLVICFGIQLAWSTDLRRQLLALMQRLRDVVAGGGDLTKRIHLRTMDDIGEITDLVNQLLDQFQSVVKRIGNAANQTRQTSGAIDQVLSNSEAIARQSSEAFRNLKESLETQASESQKLTRALESFGVAASGVNSAVETQRAYVTDSSAAMEEMASNIESVETMTARSQTLTSQLSEQGGSGGNAVNETSQAILSIEESSRQVMKVLGELNKIAASTNLLAMNAAIEAAHAGERGKGFAVVAEEVRKLANNASTQTGAIRELILTMSKRVGKGVETAKSSGQALEDLVSGLHNAALISSEISGAMKEQAIGTRSAADSLLRIVDASETIHQRMEDQGLQSRQMTTILSESIDQLGILVGNAREQTRQITELETAFAAVRKEVNHNSLAVGQLQAEIERFKVD